jgi:hypothetical protein
MKNKEKEEVEKLVENKRRKQQKENKEEEEYKRSLSKSCSFYSDQNVRSFFILISEALLPWVLFLLFFPFLH